MRQQRLHKKLKLSPHNHTGRRLPRSATSHGVLLVILLLTGVLVFSTSHVAVADITEQGQVAVAGFVRGPAPDRAAVITQPANNSTTHVSPIAVSGVCYGFNIIQIYKNGIFAGSTMCTNQKFLLSIDLLIHRNELVAKTVDNMGQYGPDSNPVVVNYIPVMPLTTGSRQLLLTTDQSYQAATAGKSFNLELIATGGKLPYALPIDWGDGTASVVPQDAEGVVKIPHTYQYGGLYKVKTGLTDSAGSKATLDVMVVVNGTPKPAPAFTGPTEEPPTYVAPSLKLIWPLYLLSIALVAVFWLGERAELYRLKKQHHA